MAAASHSSGSHFGFDNADKDLLEVIISKKVDYAIDPIPEEVQARLLPSDLREKLAARKRIPMAPPLMMPTFAHEGVTASGQGEATSSNKKRAREEEDGNLDQRKSKKNNEGDAKAVNGARAAQETDDDSCKANPLPQDFLSLVPRLQLLPPWREAPKGAYKGPATVQLHNELHDWLRHVELSPADVQLRKHIVRHVVRVIQEVFSKDKYPKVQVGVYGSFVTGLVLPTSDIDLGIQGVVAPSSDSSAQSKYKEECLKELHRLAAGLEARGLARCVTVVPANVPIVRFEYKDSQIDVDISLNAKDSVKASTDVQAALKKFPLAGPLAVLLKAFLAQRHLDDVYTGGLGGVASALLAIVFMQHYPAIAAEANAQTRKVERYQYHQPPLNLGSLWVALLRFYGKCINYTDVGLDAGKGSLFEKRNHAVWNASKNATERPWLLCLLDSNNKDVASSSYRFHAVTTALEAAYHTLLVPATQEDPNVTRHTAHEDVLMRPTLLSRLLRGDDAMFKVRVAQRAFWNEIKDTEAAEEARICTDPNVNNVLNSLRFSCLPYRR